MMAHQEEETMVEWTGLQHLAKLCEHIPVIGVLAQTVNERLAEGWRRIVYGAIAAVVGSAIIAIPSIMWAQYQMISSNRKAAAVTSEKVKHLQGRLDRLAQGQDQQTQLLRDLRMQVMRMQEAERLRNK